MNGVLREGLSFEAIMYLINHIFLPPNLPHENDLDFEYETILLDITIDSLLNFKDYLSSSQSAIIDSVIDMIANLSTVRHPDGPVGAISKGNLEIALRGLRTKGGTIPLHIRAQNAGVIISRVDDSIHIEAFELSPVDKEVITTKGRLRRSFPGSAVSLSIEVFEQSSFQATIARTLAKMSRQPVMKVKCRVIEEGQMHEDGDTSHPKVVTELFMGFLSSVGEPVDVSCLWKNTREEVMCHSSKLPWRRSPMWLLVRVAMQLAFSRSTIRSELPGDLYKIFMVFLMSHILELSHQNSLPSDLTYAMNAKLARRLLKLDPSVNGPGLNVVQQVMRDTNTLLHARWSSIMEQDRPSCGLSRLKYLDFGDDIFNSLPALDEYIELMARRKNNKSSVAFQPGAAIVKYQAEKLPKAEELLNCLDFSTRDYRPYNLRAFEDWVASNLNLWLETHKWEPDTCGKLDNLIKSYYRIAYPLYSSNVEATSIMLLTILELWIACDESATHICKLLMDYDPGVTQEPFESLVLPLKSQMERLIRAEDYLKRRRAQADFPASHIFRDFGHESSFPVRYFNQSLEHKNLLEVIESQATQARQQKLSELREAKRKYKSLMRLHGKTKCEYDVIINSDGNTRERRHRSTCKKCDYKFQATCLTIRIYEWPLPSAVTKAQSAVFELKVPRSFGCWRDTTAFFMLNVLKYKYELGKLPQSSYPLRTYSGLSSFFTSFSSTQRIGLLSGQKPYEVTLNCYISVASITEKDVCLDNGLIYEYYDDISRCFVDDFCVTDVIPKLCTYKIPVQSSPLQQFLYRPASMPNGPQPNTAIASQSDCPDHMSVDEYKALSTIPLGSGIQWQNILLQLAVPSVDFNKVETSLVILQTIHQAGPPSRGSILREGHEIVADEIFARSLLETLNEALQRVNENWESSQALSTFISLAERLLSLAPTGQIKDKCLVYLASVRTVAFGWVNLLRDKACKATRIRQRIYLYSKAVEIALICVDSFNLDGRYLDDTLSIPEAASVFIQCSIIIQEGNLTISQTSDSMTSILHQRWKGLSYRGYPILAKEILEKRSRCLDHAIKKSWSAYYAGHGWQAVSGQVSHWLVSNTAPQGSSDPLRVHFNLLTGELLVNGLPLSRLPAEYERHPTYRILFGNSILGVMPTDVQGMQFSGNKEYAGYTLHFGINPSSDSSENDLLVQAVKGNRKYELIPSRVLCGDFPVAFVDEFVHWYDIDDKVLEFRPVTDPWTTSRHNWRLTRTRAGSKWHLIKDGIALVGVKSETAKVLSNILSPLEDPLRIHILHHSSSPLEIELPRLQLGFYLEPRDLLIQSRQFRGMFIDPDQSLGTLVGLRNKLMLKHKNGGNRLVILPEGSVSYTANGDHILVTTRKDSATKAHIYRVDDQIGRLVDNGSLQSKLFLCYLHALTSFCLPDPLIHRTGTEQALSILNSAAVRSFDRLAEENVKILGQIAQLTPGRSYYSANQRCAQFVNWLPGLGFLAQHGGFYKSVQSIFHQASKTEVFYPESLVVPAQPNEVESDLLERDCIRSSTFRVSGFGAEDHTVNRDKVYRARDSDQNSPGGFKAFVISRMIYHRRGTLHYTIPSDLRDDLWEFLNDSPVILGPDNQLPTSELKYDATLLLVDSSEFLSKYWSVFHQIFSQEYSKLDRFHLMIWFSTLAFFENADMNIIQTLASFIAVPDMAQIPPPRISSLQLSLGTTVDKSKLRHVVQSALVPFSSCSEAELPPFPHESSHALQQRRNRVFERNRNIALDRLVDALAAQWPCATPTGVVFVNLGGYIDVDKAIQNSAPKFKKWFNNCQFHKYLGQIQETLESKMVSPVDMPSSQFAIPEWSPRKRRGFISLNRVLACSPRPVLPCCTRNVQDLLSSATSSEKRTPRLAALIDRLEARAGSNYEEGYVKDLRDSLFSLQDWRNEYSLQQKGANIRRVLSDYRSYCEERVHEIYLAIFSTLNSPIRVRDSSWTQTASCIKQWPRLSPILFLQQLTRGRWKRLTNDWKSCIVQYGLSLTELQRAERLERLSGNHVDLIKELRNSGHTNWSPLEYPESLLLEVESGIMIREVQEQIARQMRDPPFGENAVMQLNMGEGKSSVIVPIVAAALADGSRLVRVIVAKPQSKQMFQMLVSKFGGLLDRRVYHMPFSRALRLSETEADAMISTYKECMTNGGILLVHPEHILSFKLMGLEYLISGKEVVGNSLLSTQEFFEASSCDIVDESDENYSVKFELVYTMGMQQPIELSPERWICIQQVLDLVKMFAPSVKKDFPVSIDVDERRPGSFPRTRFLRPDAEQQIFGRVVGHICETGLKGFPIARQPEPVRQAVFRYITEPNLTPDQIIRVENQGPGGFWTDTTRNTLILLRGLIAGGVLAFAFGQKRWRVNYGLDMTRQPRTRLAVPYRAKDNPTLRSEFSHPDVVIVLTSLSYYYGGLGNEDLFLAFSHLLQSDQADVEYQAWVKDASDLSPAFQHLIGINLTDRLQCIEQVFPHLRYAKCAVDYFLAHIVFPKEMKEFPHKLSASGWDIGHIKAHPTTGFSGTNDSRVLLPLSVKQLDLQEQKHTNALVLEYLVQPENSVALMPPRKEAHSSDAQLLLAMVTKAEPTIDVILDVGAQVLELSNLGVAREWLEMISDHAQTQAVVFFNDSDELSVLDRKGKVEPLQISPFADQLDVCIIFLDEAHTRGTDLRLPLHYRAAVTLGPNLTKDRLIQACMRMRKLGKGQSVVFFVPEEIKIKILEQSLKPEDASIDVSDVLSWAISETFVDIRRSMPLWAAQGQRFEHQSAIWAEARAEGYTRMSKSQAEKFLENESRSLEDRYQPRFSTEATAFMQVSQNKNLNLIMERCNEFNILELNSATFQEEQEREFSPEIVEERQVQKPAPAQPAQHTIHPDLITFVFTGIPIVGSHAYGPAFEVLRDTSAAAHLDVSQFPRDLLVTADFARTVQIFGTSHISDAYQRPVQWILTSTGVWRPGNSIVKYMMIISPYEAQEMQPQIRQSKTATLHLYAPRTNLSFRALDGLDLYSVPTRPGVQALPQRLLLQLNMFAGQLYVSSFQEYYKVCRFLGLAWDTAEGSVVAPDGFIVKDGTGSRTSESTFTDSPVKFLKVLMTKVRRNCEGVDKTHMGRIFDGRLLRPSDFGELEDEL